MSVVGILVCVYELFKRLADNIGGHLKTFNRTGEPTYSGKQGLPIQLC